MRDDYWHAASILRTLGDAIKTCRHHGRMSAYIIKLGRIVDENPIVRAAVLELEQGEQDDEAQLRRRIEDLEKKMTEWVNLLIEEILRCKSEPWMLPLTQPAMFSLPPPMPAAVYPDIKLNLEQALQQLMPTSRLSFSSILTFNIHIAQKLQEFKDRLSTNCVAAGQFCNIIDRLDALSLEIGELSELDWLMQQSGVGRVVERLRSFSQTWKGRLLGLVGMPGGWLTGGIEQDIPMVIDLIAVQIEMGTARRYAIERLRVFFEHFECAKLRQELKSAKAAKKPCEAILQDAMDRFLFHDGYYPVTHSSASRGSLDTLILERDELLAAPPLLVELKQVTAFEATDVVSAALVRSAIGEARGEVNRYRAHIASRPQWSGTMPVIVVVHTCVEDVSDMEAADVVLIDLSEATPSRKKRRRDRS